ncbi:hypothetical protein O181_055702 [Austropuccinia psidii MF-1]|uniref:Uncharacterized protein n=1 Tax=Austropuccinia psidii MF-1 TaxID=1389203 RepID=A0A9Q3EE85_9BASI|nr:hypothetical protein [Austropuccinia psidii MF-1]
MTGPAWSSCMLIVGQPHAFIHRQLSHARKTFYSQSSNWLFSWLGGQLDCRRSPTHAWKPEANQCEFASARPMIAEAGYVCVGICHRSQKIPWVGGLFCRSFVHTSGKDPDANLGGLVPTSNPIGLNVYVAHGSRPAPPLIMPHIPRWKPSRHQSAKNFTQNQTHVWWNTTEHILPAHTQTSPQ